MKIWEKVNNITGNDSKSRYLVPYINAGSKFLLSSLPEKFLWTIASETEVNGWDSTDTTNHESLGQGSAIAYDKILAVYRYDGATTATVASVDYYRGKKRVAAESPDKNIHIFDEASSLLIATQMFPKFYKLSGKIYIKPDPDYNATSSTQTYTPLGGSSTTIATKAGDKGVIVYSAPPIIDENSDSWILTEYENIVLFYAASLDHFRLASTYRDLCKTQVDTIVGSILSNYISSMPSIVMPNEPTTQSLSFSISTSLPLAMNIATSLPTFSFSDSLPSDMIISASLPSGMNLTLSIPTLDTISTTLPDDMSFTSGLFPGAINIADVSLPSDFIQPEQIAKPNELDIALSSAKISNALTKAQELIDGTVTTNNAQAWLDDEDSEMAASTVGVANSEINRASQEISLEKARIEEFSSKVNQRFTKYQNDLNKYSQEVAKESGRIRSQLETYAQAVAREDSKAKIDLERFSKDYEKEGARITSQLAKYQREVEKSIQKYQNDISNYQQEVQKEGARANIDVANYSAELGKEKTRIETSLGLWQASLGKDVQVFTLGIQKYQAEMQKETARIGAEVAKYQAEIQKASKDMEKQIQQFSVDMQNYQGLIAGKTTKFQSDSAEAQKYLQEAGIKLQAAQIYTAKSQQSIQTSGVFYQRAINELSAITGSITAPEQQQSSQRAEQGAAT
jgi:hypothetical protein